MARPLWSGSIQISLVGFAVEIYPATNTTKPFSFHEVDRNTLARVRRQSVSSGPSPAAEPASPEDEDEAAPATHKTALHLAPMGAPASSPTTGSPQGGGSSPQSEGPGSILDNASQSVEHAVDRADIVKGYEYEQGKYAIIEPAELKNLRLAGKKTIEVSQFAKAAEIDPALYEKPYFVMPKAGPQSVAFEVVKQGMRESGMVGVGEIVFSGRQHLMTLAPPHDPRQPGMMLYTLRFATELRDARDYANNLETVKADAAQLQLAKQLIDAYSQPFELSSFKDHYEEALRELVEAKMHNLPVPQPEVETKSAKVVDLMDALRKSLLQKKPVQAESLPSQQVSPKTANKGGRTTASAKDAGVKAKAKEGGAAAGKKSKSA